MMPKRALPTIYLFGLSHQERQAVLQTFGHGSHDSKEQCDCSSHAPLIGVMPLQVAQSSPPWVVGYVQELHQHLQLIPLF